MALIIGFMFKPFCPLNNLFACQFIRSNRFRTSNFMIQIPAMTREFHNDNDGGYYVDFGD